MPLAIPNTTLADDYTTFGGTDVLADGYFTVANNPAAVRLVHGLHGLARAGPEGYYPPGTYPIRGSTRDPISGIQARNYIAGSDVQFFGLIFYPHEASVGAGTPLTTQVAASGAISALVGVPIGAMMPFGGSSAPTGWLLCDGSAVSRTTYAALFAALGTAYGAGDGSTTFNLPDLRGRLPVGLGTHTDVDALGETEGAVLGSRRPKHLHTVTLASVSKDTGAGNLARVAAADSSGAAGAVQVPAVGPQTNAPTDAPAYQVVNYIIASG